MGKTGSVLYVLCDMEGATGISPANRKAMYHGSEEWRSEGRALVTSDVKAVCDAANEFGVDEIIIDDEHDGGKREPNLFVDELPKNARVLRRPHLPGKARKVVRGNLLGMVFVGQHAMSAGGGFAPHTIAPHIGSVTLNGIRVGEIGLEMAKFMGAPLLAVVGEKAAVEEARILCPKVVGVPVKSLDENWFPRAVETAAAIRRGVLEALRKRQEMTGLDLKPPFRFAMEPADGYIFDSERRMPLRWLMRLILQATHGRVSAHKASWETNTVIGGLWVLQCVRAYLREAVL